MSAPGRGFNRSLAEATASLRISAIRPRRVRPDRAVLRAVTLPAGLVISSDELLPVAVEEA